MRRSALPQRSVRAPQGTDARAGARPPPRSACGARRRAGLSRSSSRRTERRARGRAGARSDIRRRDASCCREIGRTVEPEHGHEPAGEDRLHDLRVCVGSASLPSPGVSAGSWRRIVDWSCLELFARLDTELVERDAGVGVRTQRVGLTARAIEGEHEQLADTLAERVLAGERRRAPARRRPAGRGRRRPRSAPRPRRGGARRGAAPPSPPMPRTRTRQAVGHARARAHGRRSVRRSAGRAAPRVGEHQLEAPRIDLLRRDARGDIRVTRVTSTSGPSAFLSAATEFWSDAVANFGGSAP